MSQILDPADCTTMTEVRAGVEAWYATGINTLIIVPSSTKGGQMVAIKELFDAFSG